MRVRYRWPIVSAWIVAVALWPHVAAAQTIGTFAWQIAPYCNVVRFSVVVDGPAFRLTGYDDQCGGAQLPAAGAATARSDGQYGLSFYVVTTTGLVGHVTATLNPASFSGPWSDTGGATGTLVFSPALPTTGVHRPPPRLPSTALAAQSVTASQIADGTVGTPELADASITGAKLQLPLLGVTSSPFHAMYLINHGGGGIRGDSTAPGGTGVAGVGSIGVMGQSQDSSGVVGFTETGSAVYGISTGSGAAIRGSADTGSAAIFLNQTASNSADVVSISSWGTGDFIQATHSAGVRFRVTAAGAVQGDGAYTSPAADVAEFIDSDDALTPGDVVEIDTGHAGRFRRAAQPSSSAVAGVVTTRPGVLLNSSDERNEVSQGPALALSGRVPVKVSAENGAIMPGDLLVASGTAGHAMRAPAMPAPGTVIGKALGPHTTSTGLIEMLVMLR